MNKIWFRNKTYGYGWTPATREGWAVLLIWVTSVASVLYLFPPKNHELSVEAWLSLLLLVAALLVVCWLKGEKPEWRWGKKR